MSTFFTIEENITKSFKVLCSFDLIVSHKELQRESGNINNAVRQILVKSIQIRTENNQQYPI